MTKKPKQKPTPSLIEIYIDDEGSVRALTTSKNAAGKVSRSKPRPIWLPDQGMVVNGQAELAVLLGKSSPINAEQIERLVVFDEAERKHRVRWATVEESCRLPNARRAQNLDAPQSTATPSPVVGGLPVYRRGRIVCILRRRREVCPIVVDGKVYPSQTEAIGEGRTQSQISKACRKGGKLPDGTPCRFAEMAEALSLPGAFRCAERDTVEDPVRGWARRSKRKKKKKKPDDITAPTATVGVVKPHRKPEQASLPMVHASPIIAAAQRIAWAQSAQVLVVDVMGIATSIEPTEDQRAVLVASLTEQLVRLTRGEA